MATDAGRPALPRVSGFEITREIGAGAFASVYEAVQESVGRKVALKVMSTVAADADMERRFRAECRTVGELSWHPHVVALYEAGISDEGRPYMAMELMPGGSVSDKVAADGRLDPREVTRVGIEIADALAAAHEAGVVHRDVKPGNILIGRRGEYLLGDFGIATISDVTKSATGSFSGTVAYCAPEVLRGERAAPPADLFSLGASLYALLTGRSAFTTGTDDAPGAVILRVISEPAPPLPANTPPYLALAIERSMSKDPERRHHSAAELGDELVDALPVLSRPRTAAPDLPDVDEAPTRSTSHPGRTDQQPTGAAHHTSEHGVDARQGGTPRSIERPGHGRRRLRIVASGLAVCIAAVSVAAVIVWRTGSVASDSGGTGRTDPGESVTASIEVGTGPEGLAFGDGALWVANSGSGTVSRIDPANDEVAATINVGSSPVAVAVGDGAVWVGNSTWSPPGGSTVSRVDSTTNTVTATIDVGRDPAGVAVGEGAVWVTEFADQSVSRIDPTTNKVSETIHVGFGPQGVAVGEGAVWVAGLDGTVSRIDPATDEGRGDDERWWRSARGRCGSGSRLGHQPR